MLAERIGEVLMNLPYQIETRLYRPATVEQALTFLEKLAQPVLAGDKERQVIFANQLREGEAGPLVFNKNWGTYVSHTIETEEGRRAVPSSTWQEAFETFAEQLGCDLEAEGSYRDSFRKGPGPFSPESDRFDILREEREIPTNRENIFMLRVEERDTSKKGHPLILKGFEIRNAEAKRKWHRHRGEHDRDFLGCTW